jgi:GT2 family glycosyltransferase
MTPVNGQDGERAAPLVGLVTIWYRAAREMERFLENLAAMEYPRLLPVFVVHDQTPSEVRRLREAAPYARLIQPQANLGSAAGWNLGIKCLLDAGVDYIGIWNVDVRLDVTCLQRLVDAMTNDPAVGACQPLLLYSDAPNTVQMFGGAVDVRTGNARHEYTGATALSTLPPLRDAQYLDGGTMLIRSQLLREVGGFDEDLFMYWEDADMSRRIQLVGYRTVAVRDAVAWHYHREIGGRHPFPYQLFYETRNRFYFVRKHAGPRAWWRLVRREILDAPRHLLYYYHERQPRLVWAYLMGVLCGVLGLMGKRGWVR